MKSLRIGIIGVGRCGTYYLRTFDELGDAQVTWVAATRESTMDEALSLVNLEVLPKKTTDYQAILADPSVDAVAIATPGSTHFKIVKESLLANKHVLVEKPLAFTSKEVEELVKLADERKRVLMVGHVHMYNPPIQKLKEDIAAGLFGKIRYIRSIGSGSGPIRTDMSALWDFFPHDVSIVLHLMGKLPVAVAAQGASFISSGVEDVASLQMFFADGSFTSSLCTWLDPLKKRDVTVVGDRLSAVFDDYGAPEKLRYYQHAPSTDARKGRQQDTEVRIPFVSKALPMTEELKHFLECVQHGRVPLTDGRNALAVTKVLEAAQQSLKSGGMKVQVA
ncbi:MAG: Gfo/Idh/MocA family oxidoreductase [Nanoarchaeota archaeon]|nr:Gfo/Idh/MocA family oxidoreductase [Nanoarchaeota archaeon]